MDEFGDNLRSNEDLMLIHGFSLLDNIHDTYGTAHLAVTLFELKYLKIFKDERGKQRCTMKYQGCLIELLCW